MKTATKKVISNYAHFAALVFLLALPALAPDHQSVTIEKPVSAGKTEQNHKLQSEADALLPLFDNMPPVAVFITDAPILKSGSSIESGVAYTNCEQHKQPSIFVKKIFYEKTNQKQLVNILKHELTHAWLCRQQIMAGHDANFRRKFTAIGGFGN